MRAMQRAARMTIDGKNQKNTKYSNDDGNSKYYASYNVMKRTIREIWKIKILKLTNLIISSKGPKI